MEEEEKNCNKGMLMGLVHHSTTERKSRLIQKLLILDVYKMSDGRQLYEASLNDLEEELQKRKMKTSIDES
jgi:hypothetical protein